MKTACSLSGRHNTALALNLIRSMVGILFLVPGFGHLADPAAFAGMLTGMIGFEGTAALVLAWVVIAFEVLGGLFLILGSRVPKMLYKTANLGLMAIVIVGLVFAAQNKNMMQILFHILLLVNLFALAVTKPLCACGITGDKA